MGVRFAIVSRLVVLFLLVSSVVSKGETQTIATHLPEFAYSADVAGNSVFGFTVADDGSLVPLSQPSVPAGSAPNSVAVDPKGRFVYVANIVSDDVSAYSIAEDGTLTPVPGSPFAAGSGPGWVTVDPSGTFVYVANCAALCSGSGDGDISAYIIDQTTGGLTPVPGSPFQADLIPYAIAIDPTAHFAYVANFRSFTVSVFKIDRRTGALAAVGSPVPTGGTNSLYLTLDPHGRFLYVVNSGSQDVAVFSVAGDGTLTAVPGSPFASGQSTQAVAVDRHGDFLYVTSGFQVLGYSIQAGGVLVPLAGSPFPSPAFLVSLSLDRTGRRFYGGGAFSGVVGFDIDKTTGNLTTVPGAPFPAGNARSVTTTILH